MIKGLYSAYTGMEAAWRYQDVLANNIANANTAGYKREVAGKQSFADVLLSQQSPVPAPISARVQGIVGQIGSGTFVAQFSTDYGAGAFQNTGNELDLAVEQGFFAVESPDGTRFYTRDGRFGRDANGDLVTSQGYYVLDTNGGHINLPAERVAVDADGTIRRGEQALTQIAVLDFDPATLGRAGEAYFLSDTPGTPIDGGVRQGSLEASNTNLAEELTSLMAVYRTFQANQTIISRLDGTLNQAAGQLGVYGGNA